jgi:hypothetical protein
MKRQSYGSKLIVAVLAALALNLTASAAKPLVPFKGQSSGIVTTVGFDPELGVISTHAEGQGEATHLGRFTVTGDVAVYVFTPTGVAIGNWTYVTANGDKLFAHMIGSGGVDPLHGMGTFTILGGTGRFQGASGTYQQIITFAEVPGGSAPVDPYSDVLFNGTISYPGAK